MDLRRLLGPPRSVGLAEYGVVSGALVPFGTFAVGSLGVELDPPLGTAVTVLGVVVLCGSALALSEESARTFLVWSVLALPATLATMVLTAGIVALYGAPRGDLLAVVGLWPAMVGVPAGVAVLVFGVFRHRLTAEDRLPPVEETSGRDGADGETTLLGRLARRVRSVDLRAAATPSEFGPTEWKFLTLFCFGAGTLALSFRVQPLEAVAGVTVLVLIAYGIFLSRAVIVAHVAWTGLALAGWLVVGTVENNLGVTLLPRPIRRPVLSVLTLAVLLSVFALLFWYPIVVANEMDDESEDDRQPDSDRRPDQSITRR